MASRASKRGKTSHSNSPPSRVTRIQPHRQCANRPPRFWRFLELPPEVRNMIYSQILTIPSASGGSSAAIDVAGIWETQPRFDLSVLRVNKQIYNEAASVLYSKNTFVFLEPCDEHREFHQDARDCARHRSCNWLRMIGPDNAKTVRNMHIRIRAERGMSKPNSYYSDLILELSTLAPNLTRLAIIGEKHAMQTRPVQVQVPVPVQFPVLAPVQIPPVAPAAGTAAGPEGAAGSTTTQPPPPAPEPAQQPPPEPEPEPEPEPPTTAMELHWHRQWDPNHVTPIHPWTLYEMRHGLRKFLNLNKLVLAGFWHPKENFTAFTRLINGDRDRNNRNGSGNCKQQKGERQEKQEQGRQKKDDDDGGGGCKIHVVRRRVASRSCGERRFSTLWNEPAVVDQMGRVVVRRNQQRRDGGGSGGSGGGSGRGSGGGSGSSLITAGAGAGAGAQDAGQADADEGAGGQNATTVITTLAQAQVQVQVQEEDDDNDDDVGSGIGWQDIEALQSDSGAEEDEMDDDGIIA